MRTMPTHILLSSSEVKYDLWDQKYYISYNRWEDKLYQRMLQLRVHIVIMKEIRTRIGFDQRCVGSQVKHDQRQSIVLKCHTQTPGLVSSKSVHS